MRTDEYCAGVLRVGGAGDVSKGLGVEAHQKLAADAREASDAA